MPQALKADDSEDCSDSSDSASSDEDDDDVKMTDKVQVDSMMRGLPVEIQTVCGTLGTTPGATTVVPVEGIKSVVSC